MNQLTVAAHNQKLELWIERIRACRSSGISVTDWCGANNIGSKSYYYWMRKIKQEAFGSLPAERKSRASLNPLTSAFAEVPIPKPTPSETIRVHLAHAVVDIPDGVSAAMMLLLVACAQIFRGCPAKRNRQPEVYHPSAGHRLYQSAF